MSEDMDRWSEIETSYKLTGARIVATMKKGGAVVEDGLTVVIREGRLWVCRGDHDDPDREEELEYHLSFHVEADEVPESSVSSRAQIVIAGKHESGQVFQIEGRGWLGYDESGRIEGFFEKPPRIRVVVGRDTAARLKDNAREHWDRRPRLQ